MPLNKIPTSGAITSLPCGTFNTLVDIARVTQKNRTRFGRKMIRDVLPPSFVWRNDSESDAPEGAIVQIVEAMHVDNVIGLVGTRPNTTLAANYAISLTPVAAGETGDCVLFDAARALYESSDGTPAFGERWGIEPSSWKLRKGRYGFTIVGFPWEGKVVAIPVPIRHIVGKLGSDLAARSGDTPGGPGTLTLWYFNGSAFVASTITTSVLNTSETIVESGKLTEFSFVDGVWLADVAGSVDSEEITVVTAFQVDPATFKFQYKTRTCKAIEPQEESDWTDAHTGGDCEE